MLRKLLIISEDEKFTEQVKMMSIMLTKLNYFIDLNIITPKEKLISSDNTFYIIIDLDSPEGMSRIKEIRNDKKLMYNKIIGVYSKLSSGLKSETFKSGCDALMEKPEFLKTFDLLIK